MAKKPVNVLIMVHGMNPSPDPTSPFEQYEEFWKQLCNFKRDFPQRINKRIGVQWGHEMPQLTETMGNVASDWKYKTPKNGALRDDEKLTYAQKVIGSLVSYDAVRTDPSPNNRLMSGIPGIWESIGIPIARQFVFISLRESAILRGFGDVIYYCSEQGEKCIRREVYGQILDQLEEFENEAETRLHIFGHSLGVTLTHDFLYGLFAKDHEPGFVKEKQGDAKARDLFLKWRDKAQQGQLKVGSLISAASQLPLFIMRKQEMINCLFNNEYLNPGDIGITDNKIQWVIFYDVDDMLGFPTRRLYSPNNAILEIQIGSGIAPQDAHIGYWTNQTVIRETANLISDNAG